MRDVPATESLPTLPLQSRNTIALVVIGGLLACCCLGTLIILFFGASFLPTP